MNPQLSFSSEDIKDNLSTPKFPKNKSVNSPEKEENTLDTLKQQIDKVYNDKDTLNNDNINESKNEKNILLNSLLNNNSNLDLNNFYMSQFSFDEKSSNFLSKKENTENNPKDNNKNKNEILIKENIIENKNIIDDNDKNEENNEIKYINKITNEENEKNEDSNFDYELPLGSDDNPEFFYVCENTEENKKNVKNEKIEGGNEFPHHDIPALESKNEEILTPKKKKRNKLNEKIQSAKINFDENKLLKIKENEKKENLTKFNSSNKKINKILKYSSLIEENSKSNDYFSEPNNIINSNTYHNSFKNTNFTSKDNHAKKESNNKINNDKISINPFIFEKIEENDNIENIENNQDNSRKFKINSNIIKDITITYYDKKHKKNRNSINFMGRNNNNYNFLDLEKFNKTNIIYEKKNLSIDEPRSFSITKNGTTHHSHSRNYKELKTNNKNNNIKNETMTSTNYFIKNRIKNRVILLTKDKNRKNPQDFLGRNNSLKNFFLSEYENFSQKSLEKKNIEGKTERSSPFRKSKITDSFMTKNPSFKNYILQNKNNNRIKHNKKNISQTTFNDYYPKEELIYPNNTTYMNLTNKNHIYHNHNKGNLTQRNKDIGPINIYSKKILFIPNGNNNSNKLKQNIIENVPNNNNTNKIKSLKKREYNKSYIIPKEKNIKIIQNEISNLTKNKTRTKFNEYFKDILSNINITKTLVNQKPNLNNKKPKEQNEKHKIRKIIQLSNIDINTMTTKTIQTSNRVNNEIKNKLINKDKNKIKNTFAQSRKNIIEMFRNNILNYSINRNNKNNQVKNEVSIFIGDKMNNNKNKNINLKKNLLCKNKNNDKSKKTIINVNQYYSSYYIKK